MVNLHLGGVQQTVWNCCRQLDPERYLPMACALEENGDLGRQLADAGFPVVSLGLNLKPHRPRMVWELARLMRRQRIDILHAAAYHPSLLGRLAAILARVPIRVHHEHSLIHRRRLNRVIMNNLLGRFTDAHLAVSQAVRRQAIDWYGLAPDRVEVLYNAVQPDFFAAPAHRETARARLGLAPEARVIGMVSRLSLDKGYKYLFAALAPIKDAFPLKMLVVGFGHQEAEVRALAESHGLGGVVEFLGIRRDVPELLAAMDVFVLPSDQEGFSVALVEAMAAGLPVVVSDLPGNLEAVEHRVSGLAFPRGDIEALRNNLLWLLGNPELARSFGLAARERAAALFTVDRYGRRIQGLYDRLVREKIDPFW